VGLSGALRGKRQLALPPSSGFCQSPADCQRERPCPKCSEITLPDGSVREVSPGTTPADVAAAIGPGLAKAAIGARVDGELFDVPALRRRCRRSRLSRRAMRPMRSNSFATITRTCWPKRCRRCSPARRSPFGPSTDDGFYYDFAPRNRAFTEERPPRHRRSGCARSSPRDKPLTARSLEPRQRPYQCAGCSRARRSRPNGHAELPESDEPTVYWSGSDWLDIAPRPPPCLHRQARSCRRSSSRACPGAYWRGDQDRRRCSSRVYGTGWLNKKQLGRAPHAAAGGSRQSAITASWARRSISSTSRQEAHRQRCSGTPKAGPHLPRAGGLYAPPPSTGAGYQRGQRPRRFWTRRSGSSLGHWGKYRENMFVIPDEVPSTEDEGPVLSGEGELDGLEADELPGACADLQAGPQVLSRPAACASAEFGCCHRNEPHGALHGLMRVRQIARRTTRISSAARTRSSAEVPRVLRPDLTDLRGLRLRHDRRSSSRLRPEKRVGTDEMWDTAETEWRMLWPMRRLAPPAIRAARNSQGEGAFYAPKLECAPDGRHRPRLAGCGTMQLDCVLPERLDAGYVAEDGEQAPPGHAPPRDLRLASSASSAS